MSKHLRIGIDVDGVLADFTRSYYDELCKIEPRAEPYAPPTRWDAADYWGFTKKAKRQFWATRGHDPEFWYGISPLVDGSTQFGIAALNYANSLYFITSRPIMAKRATERWIQTYFHFPSSDVTVLIADEKGFVARGLALDMMFDDKIKHLDDTRIVTGGKCTTFLVDQPWNRVAEDVGHIRVQTVEEGYEIYKRARKRNDGD